MDHCAPPGCRVQTHHVPVHPHAGAQLHVDVAVVLEEHVHVVRHHVLVARAALVDGVAALVVRGVRAGLLAVAPLAHARLLRRHAHTHCALVDHVLLHGGELALLQRLELGQRVLVHHGQPRANELVHLCACPGHVLLWSRQAHHSVAVGLAALLELNDVHDPLGLPGLAVLVLEEGALAQVVDEGLVLGVKHPVHHVRPVLPRLAGQQGSCDLGPVGVAGKGDEEGAAAVRVRHRAGVVNLRLQVPASGLEVKRGKWRCKRVRQHLRTHERALRTCGSPRQRRSGPRGCLRRPARAWRGPRRGAA